MGVKDLAEIAGVGEAWVRRNKWLEVIYNRNPDKWSIVRLTSRGRGKRLRRL